MIMEENQVKPSISVNKWGINQAWIPITMIGSVFILTLSIVGVLLIRNAFKRNAVNSNV